MGLYLGKEKINNLSVGAFTSSSGGGIDTSDATATAADIGRGKTAYISNGKVVGTGFMPGSYKATCSTFNLEANEGVITLSSDVIKNCFLYNESFPMFLVSFPLSNNSNDTTSMIAYPIYNDKNLLNDLSTVNYIASRGTSSGIVFSTSTCVFSGNINETVTLTWNICDSTYSSDAYNSQVPISLEVIALGEE